MKKKHEIKKLNLSKLMIFNYSQLPAITGGGTEQLTNKPPVPTVGTPKPQPKPKPTDGVSAECIDYSNNAHGCTSSK